MVANIMPAIGRSMATQVTRVNGQKSATANDLIEIIASLREELALERQKRRDLEFEVTLLRGGDSKGRTLKGRTVITVKEAAVHLHVSISSISRALTGKSKYRKLEGFQDAGGYWSIYVDSLAGYKQKRKKS